MTEASSLLATGSLSAIRWEWDARACALPVFAGAGTAPLRENHFSRHFQLFAAKLSSRAVPRRRGGLCTPASGVLPLPGNRPIRPPGVRLPPLIMSCLGLGTALPPGRGDRAPPRQRPPRYPRPSTARRPVWACPPPGGAGSARPQGRLCLYPEIALSGPRSFACPSMIMTCPGSHRIRISGPAERVPVREEKLEGCEARVATLGKEKSIFWSRREEVSRNSPPWVEKYRSSGAVWRLRREKFPFSPSSSMRRQGRSRS